LEAGKSMSSSHSFALSNGRQFADLALSSVDEDNASASPTKNASRNAQKRGRIALSATPNSATLHSVLVAFADMSVIETPSPATRLAIPNRRRPLSQGVSCKPPTKRTCRDRPVFFIHNRVDIDLFARAHG